MMKLSQITSLSEAFSLESCVSEEEVDEQRRDDEQFIADLLCAVPAQPFIFRNYQYPAGTPEIPFAISEGSPSSGRGNANASPQVGYKRNAFIGSSKHHVCQTIRASSVAPYYLEDFSHDVYRWQDGDSPALQLQCEFSFQHLSLFHSA
ncbi:Phospholipase A I [Camellia lanceoleosa]|uniref:Phospholipase A I n=1 Tax=Camellia lanceoleosa TaxID=1840588 RepID=A0ACC0FIY9_9ERIC|nr:Phospholipase A I [Camellia lanceoleosa]